MERAFEISDMAFTIGGFALSAMLYEVSCYPSPGLVSPISQGAHKDMDYFTFIDSASVLEKYLILCAQAGFSPDSEESIFSKIRGIGREGELEMFSETCGINTHKGMLFVMGICCAASAKALYEKKKFKDISDIIKNMTRGLSSRELGSIEKKEYSHGEKIYRLYGVRGIRGEAEAGLPVVFDYALDFYKSNCDLDKNSRLVQTLIYIMQYCEDTTILYRHSVKVLEEVKNRASEIIAAGGMRSEEGRKSIYEMDSCFKKRRISPGGSADLLAAVVFFSRLESMFNNEE